MLKSHTVNCLMVLGLLAILGYIEKVSTFVLILGLSVGLAVYALQELIRQNREKKYQRFCQSDFLDRVYEELIKEINWDSLYLSGEPKLLGLSTLTGKTLNDQTVVIGALDNLDYLNEVLHSANETVTTSKLTSNVPFWLYIPQPMEQDCSSKLAEGFQIPNKTIIKAVIVSRGS